MIFTLPLYGSMMATVTAVSERERPQLLGYGVDMDSVGDPLFRLRLFALKAVAQLMVLFHCRMTKAPF